MKSYPSIPKVLESLLGRDCIGFHKYDGSLLRFFWSKKTGWYKYGTRTRMLDEKDPEYGVGIPIFHDKYAKPIEDIISKHYGKVEGIIAFCEFFGPHSFSGIHDPTELKNKSGGKVIVESNEPKQLKLIDVGIHKKGFIVPKQFVELFGDLDIAEVLYRGPLTQELVADVRAGKYNVNEGLVCKGGNSVHEIWMAKIKTHKYLEELKTFFNQDWEKFWE